MKKKIALYTCITGDYDEVKEFNNLKEKSIDYYLFTNNKKITSGFWNVIYIDNEGLDNIRLARKIKILGHEIIDSYDINVWIDGATIIKSSINEFLTKYCDMKKYSLVGFKHSVRDCIYDEALECVKVKKETKEIARKQIEKYKSDNYPAHNGLIESTILIRRGHDKELKKTMTDWFEEIKKYSYRDQLSFNYVAYKNKLKYNLLNLNVFDNNYFTWEKHPVKKELKNFTVYFGSMDEFDFDSILIDTYKKDYNNYVAKFKCNKDCKEIKFEFANCGGISFSHLKVLGDNIESQNLVNFSQYYEFKVFDFNVPTLFLYGDFKKNQVFEISIDDMSFIKEEEYLKLLDRFNKDLILYLKMYEELSSESIFHAFIRKLKNKFFS